MFGKSLLTYRHIPPPKSPNLLASRVCTHTHQAEAKIVIIMEESEAASLHPAVLSRVSIFAFCAPK